MVGIFSVVLGFGGVEFCEIRSGREAGMGRGKRVVLRIFDDL